MTKKYEKQADHLLTLRNERGLSKRAIYKELKVDAKTYDTWEKGETRPGGDSIKELSEKYGVSSDYILGLSDYRNVGNREIMEATGLSEKSIEVLRFLVAHQEDIEDEIHHMKIVKLINTVLESTYAATINYRNDSSIAPVENVFTVMADYINPQKAELSFRNGENRITISGNFATLDADDDLTIYTVDELKRSILSDRIKKQLHKFSDMEKKRAKEAE